jgi:hypothetical protein
VKVKVEEADQPSHKKRRKGDRDAPAPVKIETLTEPPPSQSNIKNKKKKLFKGAEAPQSEPPVNVPQAANGTPPADGPPGKLKAVGSPQLGPGSEEPRQRRKGGRESSELAGRGGIAGTALKERLKGLPATVGGGIGGPGMSLLNGVGKKSHAEKTEGKNFGKKKKKIKREVLEGTA